MAAAAGDESKGGECCPPGSHPALVLDKSREKLNGKVQTLESGLVVYTVPPGGEGAASCKKAVIVVYDVHGFSGGRIKGVCDTIAAAGYHVVMPDVYGDEVGINDKGGFASDTGPVEGRHWRSLWFHRLTSLCVIVCCTHWSPLVPTGRCRVCRVHWSLSCVSCPLFTVVCVVSTGHCRHCVRVVSTGLRWV